MPLSSMSLAFECANRVPTTRRRHNLRYSKGIVELDMTGRRRVSWSLYNSVSLPCPCSVTKELYFFKIGILTLCLDWITVLIARRGKLSESGGPC
jgi:hypothetical protein